MKKKSTKLADLLLTGGRLFTGNPRQPFAEAVGIRDNRIIAVGSSAGLAPLAGRTTRVVDLAGRFVVAGFADAHCHLLAGGLSLTRVDLNGCASREELIERLRRKVASLSEGEWLLGRGWDHERLGAWPHRDWLDEAFGDRPALLYRTDGHTAWVSSAALKRAGLAEAAESPAGGEIVRDEWGRPTGILKESAIDPVASAVPPASPADRRQAIEAALGQLRRYGITSVHELSPPGTLQTYRELRDEGRLTARVSAWMDLGEDLAAADEAHERFPSTDPLIRCDTLKAFVDGALGAGTAAMIDPYDDDPSSSGTLRWDERELGRVVRKAHQNGFQVALHALGDRGVHVALAVLDGLGGGGKSRRHRIEHAEVVSPGDVARFSAVGAVVSMQPSQLLSDAAILERRLGRARLGRVFPWRSLLSQKVPLILGTDWPIEPLDPLRTLRGATAPRIPPDGAPGIALDRTGLQLTVDEALVAMTRTPAWATFEEEKKGTLSAGQLADLAVLSADPFSISPDEFPAIEVKMTIFDGRVVWEADSE